MPRIVIQDEFDRTSTVTTLNERIAVEHVRDHHYAAQLIERLRWATADAESFELRSPEQPRPLPGGAGPGGAGLATIGPLVPDLAVRPEKLD